MVCSDLLWVINLISASFKLYNAGLLLSMLPRWNGAQLDQRMAALHILISGISLPFLLPCLTSIKESVTTGSGERAQSAECWPLKQEDLSQVADEQQ